MVIHIIVINFFLKVLKMTSRPAVVLVVLAVALIAFCFAGVFASMTGTYHLNLDFGNNNSSESGFFGNLTEFNGGGNAPSSGSGSVQTYEDTSSSSNSNSHPSDSQESAPATEDTPQQDTGGQHGPTPSQDSGGGSSEGQVVTTTAG